MRHLRLAVLSPFAAALVLSACAAPVAPEAPVAPQPSAAHAQLLEDVRILSADDMQGRDTGAEGGAKARAYIVGRL